MLAPWVEVHPSKSGRLSGRLAFVFDLGAPLTTAGRTQALRSGETGRTPVSRAGPGMAHRGDPRSNAGERACRAFLRHRVVGQSLLLPLAFEKGSRCKSETISRHYRRNGYVHIQQKIGGRYRRNGYVSSQQKIGYQADYTDKLPATGICAGRRLR